MKDPNFATTYVSALIDAYWHHRKAEAVALPAKAAGLWPLEPEDRAKLLEDLGEERLIEFEEICREELGA